MQFTTVKRAISAMLIDGPDEGAEPDVGLVQGEVTFTPLLEAGDSVQVQTVQGPVTVVLTPITVRISDGVVMHRGSVGVQLFAGGEGCNPERVRWRASFAHLQSRGVPFVLRDVVFDAVPGGEVDLTAVAPLAGLVEPIVRGPQGTSVDSVTVEGSDLVVWGRSESGSIARLSSVDLSAFSAESARVGAVQAADQVRERLAGFVSAGDASASAAAGSAAAAAESAASAGTDAREVDAARQIVDAYRLEVTTAHGETLAARDVAAGAAETATRQAETATGRAGAAAASAAAAGQSETSAGVSAQTATQQADRATGEADRATVEADRAAQAAADSSVKAVAEKVNELLAGAPEAYDTLLEIAQELERGASAEAALTAAIAGKAPADHTHTAQDVGAAPASHEHTTAQVTGLDTALAGKAPISHTHTMSQVTDLPALETPTREASDRANKIAVRDSQGRLLSQNYANAAAVLAMEQELPHTLASLWAARQVATDVVNARTPKIVEVAALPASPDPSTVYLVME